MVRVNADKVEIILLYGQANRNYHEAARLFNNVYADRPVSPSYVKSVVDKFTTTFSVKDAPRSGRPSVKTEELQIQVLGTIAIEPKQSVRKIATDVGTVGKSTVHEILQKHKFHPFKVHLVQELNEDDPDRRLQFCETMEHLIATQPNYLYRICFSDEASFFVNGSVNRHNCRYWSDQNPRWIEEAHTQHPEKLNVWAGIMGNTVIGPFFIEGNLTGRLYLQLLEEAITPAIIAAIENDAIDYDPIFQQDGAPPHFHGPVREYLDEEFPGRWIGRRGAIEWPPRSPDLAPLDFFLWGYVKERVFTTQPETLQELRQRITDVCATITPEILTNVRAEFQNRLYYCQEVGGSHFEHLIK